MPCIVPPFSQPIKLELRGIEPLSESLSLPGPTIIVCVFSFPLSGARRQARDFSSFIGSFFSAKLKRKSAPPFMMPIAGAAGDSGSASGIKPLTRNYFLRVCVDPFFYAATVCGWLPELRDPRRNQYNPRFAGERAARRLL